MVCSASTTACCKGRGVNSNTASKVRCVDASGKRASQPVLFKASSAFCCRRVSNQLGRSAQSSGVPNGKYCWFEPIQSAKLVSPASSMKSGPESVGLGGEIGKAAWRERGGQYVLI